MSDSDRRILLTSAQVAQKLGVTTVTVQRWAKSGSLAHMKLPGQTGAYLFDPETIDALAREEGARA